MARGSRPGSSRMAPSTARSASRLCGGTLPGTSILVAMPGDGARPGYSALTVTVSAAVTSPWRRTGTL